MPHSIRWEHNGGFVRFWGKVSIANVFDIMEQVCADSRFDRLSYILADYREVME